MALFLAISLVAIGCPAPVPEVKFPRLNGFPERPLTFLIGFGVGGGTDLAARSIGKAVEEILGVKIIYINMPGAAGSIAENHLMGLPADGYTILVMSGDLPTNLLVGRNPHTLEDYIPFARVQQDVGQIQINAKDTRFTNVEEFVAYAKVNRVSIGGTGAGGLDEIGVTLFAKGAGFFENLSFVPYEKAGMMHAALIAGDIDACFEEPGPAIELIKAGLLKPIITFAEERLRGFEEVPTAIELGYGNITLGRVRGFVLRAGTDEAIVNFLEGIIKQAYYSDFYQKWEHENFLDLRPGWGDRQTYTRQKIEEMAIYEEILRVLGYLK